jgi:hypothetical protein
VGGFTWRRAYFDYVLKYLCICTSRQPYRLRFLFFLFFFLLLHLTLSKLSILSVFGVADCFCWLQTSPTPILSPSPSFLSRHPSSLLLLHRKRFSEATWRPPSPPHVNTTFSFRVLPTSQRDFPHNPNLPVPTPPSQTNNHQLHLATLPHDVNPQSREGFSLRDNLFT